MRVREGVSGVFFPPLPWGGGHRPLFGGRPRRRSPCSASRPCGLGGLRAPSAFCGLSALPACLSGGLPPGGGLGRARVLLGGFLASQAAASGFLLLVGSFPFRSALPLFVYALATPCLVGKLESAAPCRPPVSGICAGLVPLFPPAVPRFPVRLCLSTMVTAAVHRGP